MNSSKTMNKVSGAPRLVRYRGETPESARKRKGEPCGFIRKSGLRSRRSASTNSTPEGNGTKLLVDHDAYPEGPSPRYPSWHEHLFTNGPVFYFELLAKYLAA